MKLTRRTAIWIVLALGGVAAVAASLRPRPLDLESAAAARGSMQVTVDEEGETRLARRYLVSAPVPARVLRIELRPGDPVVAGQTVLATLQPIDPALLDVRSRAMLQARVKTAEAAVSRVRAERERARVEHERAAAELTRQQALAAADLVPKDSVEALEARVRGAEESRRAAEFTERAAAFEVEQARAALFQGRDPTGAAVVVRAPITGVVLKRLQESETVVLSGAPLLEIGDLRDLEIVSDLLSTDAVRVRPGAKVYIDRWGGDRPLIGRVRRVEPSGFTKISALGVEEQRVNVLIDFEDRPDTRPSLGDAFRVEVRIVVAERQDVVMVPTSALFRAGDRWATFVIANRRAVRRTVTVGLRNDEQAEVTEGLTAGERVVLYPPEGLEEGALVRAGEPR